MSVSQKYGVRKGAIRVPFMISCEDILAAAEEAELIFVTKALVLENNIINYSNAPVEDITYNEIVELGNHKLTIIGLEEYLILKSNRSALDDFSLLLNEIYKPLEFSTSEFAIYKK